MGLRDQLRILRASGRIVLASLVITVAVALVLSFTLPKTWESSNKLIVGNAIGANTPDYNAQLLAQQLSQSYALVATTGPVLQHVIDQLGLDVTVDDLQKRVSADAPRSLNVVEITASWRDPQTAAAIANAVSDELVQVVLAAGGRSTDILSFVDQELKTTQQQISDIRSQMDKLSQVTNPTIGQQTQLNLLQTQLVQANATYASLLTYASGTAANKLTVIDPAVPATDPASPKPLVNLLAAVVVGLLAGVGLAFVRDQLDDSLKTPEQVSAVLGLPTLASIARMEGLSERDPIYRLTVAVFPRSSAAESFRMLRTNLEFASVDHPLKLIAVTSAVPGEGKTLVAANLGVAFAQAGYETILVDADLRKSETHTLFGLTNTTGLTTLLRSADASLDEVLQATVEPKLRLLASGPHPPNPAELLGSKAMARIIAQLRAAAEIIIFDTPPLEAVTDAAVLGASLDGTVLVAHAGRTGRVAARSALDALRRVDTHVLGVTLNLAGKQAINAYGYYGASGPGGPSESPEGAADPGQMDAPYRQAIERNIRTGATSGEPRARI
jgi:capsular exopolysaccharide synthesis family protein